MIYVHTKCGGEIDPKKRVCTKCKKKWNRFSFYFDPSGIRPRSGESSLYPPKKDRQKYAKWADRTPGAKIIPSLLPNWPRWARILSTVVFLGLVGLVLNIIFHVI